MVPLPKRVATPLKLSFAPFEYARKHVARKRIIKIVIGIKADSRVFLSDKQRINNWNPLEREEVILQIKNAASVYQTTLIRQARLGNGHYLRLLLLRVRKKITSLFIVLRFRSYLVDLNRKSSLSYTEDSVSKDRAKMA